MLQILKRLHYFVQAGIRILQKRSRRSDAQRSTGLGENLPNSNRIEKQITQHFALRINQVRRELSTSCDNLLHKYKNCRSSMLNKLLLLRHTHLSRLHTLNLGKRGLLARVGQERRIPVEIKRPAETMRKKCRRIDRSPKRKGNRSGRENPAYRRSTGIGS